MKRVLFFVAVAGALLAVVLAGLSTTTYALDENGCMKCHSNPNLKKQNGQGKTISLYLDEVALEASAHRYIDCTQCHPNNPHAASSPLNKLSLTERCGHCHQYEARVHRESIHGQWLARGNEEVAGCVDCHSAKGTPHSIARVLSPKSPAYRKNIADTCTKCHGNETLMANYGIVEKIYETYMRSFHGKAMRLTDYDLRKLNTATCTNCHGVHNIKKTDDPNSPVASVENLAAICEQCHPGSGANFASGFMGHKEASPQSFPVVYYIEKFFMVFTATVVAGGISLVGLTFTSSTARRLWRKRKNH